VRHLNILCSAIFAVAVFRASGQDLDTVSRRWTETVDAIRSRDQAGAQAAFAHFNAAVKEYVAEKGRTWQVEYLMGSLDCLFPSTRAIGADLLDDVRQNSKALSSDGLAEIRRQMNTCKTPSQDVASLNLTILPINIGEPSTHMQSPFVRGDMKGGGRVIVQAESTAPVSPIPAAQLEARRVPLGKPQRALDEALSRMPRGAAGAVAGNFAVATVDGTKAQAEKIGLCLQSYAVPLSAEFQIDSPAWMVTAYAVPDQKDVYEFAGDLHGLQLPQGVIAYSVPEDMSLASTAPGGSCGSMAHELVHLLIKKRFPGAPAWLEEGLASEVAIALPTPAGLRFDWSWRDVALASSMGIRPKLDELLAASWSDFNATSPMEAQESAATQAMAAVFIRYLDARGKLRGVYFEVRDHHVNSDLSFFKSYRTILEENLNMPVAAIEADFTSWFVAEQKRHTPAHLAGEGSSQPMNTEKTRLCTPATNSPIQQSVPCSPANTAAPTSANEPPRPNTEN
jgi:hypothetical protein